MLSAAPSHHVRSLPHATTTLRRARRSWPGVLALVVFVWLPGCLTSRHRHDVTVLGERGDEVQEHFVVWTWADEEAFFVPVYLLGFDTLLFPIDALISVVSATQAMFDEDREIAHGPLGALASLLPGISSANVGGPGDDILEPQERDHTFRLSATDLERLRQWLAQDRDVEALEIVLLGDRSGQRHAFIPRLYRIDLLHRVERE